MKLLIILDGPYEAVIGIIFSKRSVESQLKRDLAELTMLKFHLCEVLMPKHNFV